MNLYFNIEYQTIFGEEVVLNVFTDDECTPAAVTKYRMNTVDGQHWTCCITQLPAACKKVIHYYYGVDCAGTEKRKEWTLKPHRLELTSDKAKVYHIYDRWSDMPEDAYLYSSAFTDCIRRKHGERKETPRKTEHAHTGSKQNTAAYEKTLRLIVSAPQLRSEQRLMVVGNDLALGAWTLSRAIDMTEVSLNEWAVDLDIDRFSGHRIELKFVAVSADKHTAPLWETGYNRILELPELKKGEVVVYSLNQAFFELCNERFAGTLVPVFSLRSKESFGVGDFGDLQRMINFVSATRQRVLQVLPINDTTTTHTWTDSYPYSCISIFAIHPQYVDLTQLPPLKDAKVRARFKRLQEELNALPQIDYERVNATKNEYLRLIFEQEGSSMMKSAAFSSFFNEEAHWLVPYAQYCYLRDQYDTADFSQWKDHHTWDETQRKALSTPTTKAYKQVSFFYFVQFILSQQMQAAHEYAKSKGVILKGDIPIGVSRYGCDVWMEPKYFHMNGQAGAPPDDFSVNGQNWGFPTYNWDEMLKDNCAWWVRRFQYMAKFFDAYRIDHVLGFFRIWEIPITSVHGLLGQFSPALGLSREEIEAYGLPFNEDAFTRPFIADWVLARMFGEHADEVKATYLQHDHDDIWQMRPEYDTQRKVEAAFEGREDDKNLWIRDALYALISDVLFVRDRKDPLRFHPRISVQHSFVYEALWDKDKVAFNNLYNDYYYRRNNQFWYNEAMKKLPMLTEATRMLVCAEDLGMVPACVDWVMNQLRILSLEVQSMPKDANVRFGNLNTYPYRSVCTFSSHDMPTLRQWWDEDPSRTQVYYNSMLYKQGDAPHPLPGWLARDIILQQLRSPSMLCILSIQDWLSTDEALRLPDADAERINIPANPRHYWRYRMHITIEELMNNVPFCTAVTDLVQQSGR